MSNVLINILIQVCFAKTFCHIYTAIFNVDGTRFKVWGLGMRMHAPDLSAPDQVNPKQQIVTGTTEYFNKTMFTRCRYGAKTAWKSNFIPFCSHDAGTKLYDTVTFTVTKQCRFLNGMRWERNASRYRVNTENGTFWYRFSSQLSNLKLFYSVTQWTIRQTASCEHLLKSHLKLTGIV